MTVDRNEGDVTARREMLERAEMRWMSAEDSEITVRARDLALLGREAAVLLRERDEAREALEPFTGWDFHATQWIAGMEHDGHELRALRAEDIDLLIAQVEHAKTVLAAVPASEEPR